jgi:hypothetical protein
MEGKQDVCMLSTYHPRCDACYACVEPFCCDNEPERHIFARSEFMEETINLKFCGMECVEKWDLRQRRLKTGKIVKPRLTRHDVFDRPRIQEAFEKLYDESPTQV